MTNIAIFASGTGSNARKIIDYFEGSENVKIRLIVSNKQTAKVLDMAKEKDIPSLVINRTEFYQSENILEKFSIYEVNFVVLAGFLLLIPEYLVTAFPQRMINIHPALLPKYGGKGMFGMNVHKAVYEAQEKTSGITIHYVNNAYDEGGIIFQTECELKEQDQPEDIARKVQALEHHYFPKVIEQLVLQKDYSS